MRIIQTNLIPTRIKRNSLAALGEGKTVHLAFYTIEDSVQPLY